MTNIIIEWFQRMRDFDPNIKLALNDFGIFNRNGSDAAHRANFEYWLGLLNDANLLDVIGEQSHYTDAGLTDIPVFEQLVNSYHTQFNKPIAITEFDVTTSDEQLQADYLRDYMTMAFSQSAITEFLHWGFWQDAHWRPDAALYRSDFSIKPNGQAYEDLVFGEWWSDIQGTSRSGSVTANVFLGEYDVIVEYNGQTYTGVVTVDATGSSSVTINVPQDPVNYDPIVEVNTAAVAGNVLSELNNDGVWSEPENETVTLSASLGTVTPNVDGTWAWSFVPEQVYTNEVVTITATDARGGTAVATFEITTLTNVWNRGVSYGGSAVFPESVSALDKTPLLPGEIATQANFTNYTKGINRVIVEIAGLASSSLNQSDFEFRVGNTDNPSNWMLLTASSSIPLPTISVDPSATAGADQVLLTWQDNVIQNNWLQVRVKANGNTGLATDDVFYFGNQIGDVNGDVNVQNQIRVNAFDTGLTRINQSPVQMVPIDNPYDVDRNGLVNAFDTGRIRLNQTTGGLLMFTAPMSSPASNTLPGETRTHGGAEGGTKGELGSPGFWGSEFGVGDGERMTPGLGAVAQFLTGGFAASESLVSSSLGEHRIEIGRQETVMHPSQRLVATTGLGETFKSR